MSGGASLPDAPRIDRERMRQARLERALGEMESREIDALILGREANARYVSDARRLWLAGTRPFGPGCVLVRESREIHLLSNTDDGVPETIPPANFYGMSWNPLRLLDALKRIPGLASARRVGIDASTPLMTALLPRAVPRAELVDGAEAMHAARRIKTADEIACIRAALAITEAALADVIAALAPGVPERHLAGVFQEGIARLGVTTPALDGIFCATPRHVDALPGLATEPRPASRLPFRQLASERPLADGDLVAISVGTLYLGYEGTVALTWPCGGERAVPPASRVRELDTTSPGQRLHQRWRAVLDRLLAECRPGRSCGDLRRAYAASGEPPSGLPIAHGIGLGCEPPLVGGELGGEGDAACVLEPGMVLALQAYVWSEGVGGYFGKETVRITAEGPEVLGELSRGHLAS